MTAKDFHEVCQGKWKIFVLHLNVISNYQKFQPSTFQCSAQGTFHTNMQSSHFYLFKAFANCFHTLIWKGESNTSFGLIKGKCIIFLLPNLKSFYLWPPFPSPMLLAIPAVPQTQDTRKVCVSTLLPNQYAQILIYCKSSSHAHQIWYQAQTILT